MSDFLIIYFVIFLFVIISALTCIVTVPLYITIKYLNAKYFHITWLSGKKLIIPIGLLTILLGAYQTYTAFYPSDSFFEDEFENNTRIEFPRSGEILMKDASYPDMHGDYSSSAIFVVNESEYNSILYKIKQNSNFKHDTLNRSFAREILKKVNSNNNDNLKIFYANDPSPAQTLRQFAIAFDDKNKRIIFERISW